MKQNISDIWVAQFVVLCCDPLRHWLNTLWLNPPSHTALLLNNLLLGSRDQTPLSSDCPGHSPSLPPLSFILFSPHFPLKPCLLFLPNTTQASVSFPISPPPHLWELQHCTLYLDFWVWLLPFQTYLKCYPLFTGKAPGCFWSPFSKTVTFKSSFTN